MASSGENPDSGIGARLKWPSRLLGPPPGLREINMICWGLLAGVLLARFAFPLLIELKAGTAMSEFLPADFIYFYGIGHIAHTAPLAQVYDYNLQLKTFNEIYALHDGAYGPSPYPPFVALFFSLFARLPFAWAFATWALISLALYVTGVVAVSRTAFPGEPLKTSLTVCFALAFYPFAIGTLVNGQLSAIAVCAVACAFALESRGRLFGSGLALSVLAYKPTLLVVLLPMLLLTRRFRTLAGFVSGAAALGLAATASGGVEVWRPYARFLRLIGRVAGASGQSGLPLWKYVDLDSCFYAITSGRYMWIPIASAAIVGCALAVLFWRSAAASPGVQCMAWAAALTFTLLMNVYVPIYDSVLAVVSVVLTLGALRQLHLYKATGWVASLSVALVAVSWVTTGVAEAHRVQLLSLLLAVLAGVQLHLLRRAVVANGRGLAG